jgi:GalNAc5-diNAcBac-PP-undecaprenol beta-1,3-glucosyltransferase
MSDNPLVSVVIPTYNRAGLVGEAIESVRQQSYRNLEIIVVDDGSPDNTENVVRSVPDQRIRYLRHKKNKGLPAGRNTGIKAAKGEYIAFLDDDDRWREDKLERQISAVNNYDAVLCTAVSNGRPLRVHKRPSISLDDLRRGSFDPSSLLAKSSVLKELLFDESLRQGEDWDAFIRIAQRYQIGWVPEPLLLYNDGIHQRMTNDARVLSGIELEKRAAMLNKHREFFGERWFRFHLADLLLTYIGSRASKFESVRYAVKRCGIRSVAAVMVDKVQRRIRRALYR